MWSFGEGQRPVRLSDHEQWRIEKSRPSKAIALAMTASVAALQRSNQASTDRQIHATRQGSNAVVDAVWGLSTDLGAIQDTLASMGGTLAHQLEPSSADSLRWSGASSADTPS